MDNAITTALCIMVIVLVVSLIMVSREGPPQAQSCNSTLPGCEERFFGNPPATREDVDGFRAVLNRSMEEIAESIVAG